MPSESPCRIPSTGIIRLGCWLCWLLDWMKLSPETCTAHYARLARPNPHIIQPQIRRQWSRQSVSQSGRIAFQLTIANCLCFLYSSHFFCTLLQLGAASIYREKENRTVSAICDYRSRKCTQHYRLFALRKHLGKHFRDKFLSASCCFGDFSLFSFRAYGKSAFYGNRTERSLRTLRSCQRVL